LDEDFLERYARARKECLEIADRGKDSENESQARIQRDRLRVDTRKWMAARLAPKKYGGQISDDVQGNTTLNFQPAVLIKVGPVEVSPAPEAGSGGLPSLARQPAAGIGEDRGRATLATRLNSCSQPSAELFVLLLEASQSLHTAFLNDKISL